MNGISVPSVVSSRAATEVSKHEEQQFASSLEEAGALLGAAITRLSPTAISTSTATSTSTSTSTLAQNKEQHATKASLSPSPSSHGSIHTSPQEKQQAILFELFCRLHDLQKWLRSSSSLSSSSSTAAQSILALLMKLFQSCVASTNPHCAPMLSHGIRHAWANSVSICAKLSSSQSDTHTTTRTSATKSTDSKAIIPFMMDFLASTNPKSQKAYGGTRLAAICVLKYMYSSSESCDQDNDYYQKHGSRWAMDVLLQVSVKGIKSYYANRDDPHQKIASIQCATNILIAQRTLRLSSLQQQQQLQNKYTDFVVLGTLDDRGTTTPELIVKLVRQASEDAYPEVRCQAAMLASVAASIVVTNQKTSSTTTTTSHHDNPLAYLEELIVICFKNLDDAQASVSIHWANALARCMCASMDCAQILNIHSTTTSASSVPHTKQQQDDSGLGDVVVATSATATTQSKLASKWKTFRSLDPTTMPTPSSASTTTDGTITSCCKTLLSCIELLVSMFQKTGGEYVASPLGGTHSLGGRATRIGYANTLIHLLRLVLASSSSASRAIHWNVALAPDVVSAILLMVAGHDGTNHKNHSINTKSNRQPSPSTLSADIIYNNTNTSTSSSATATGIFRGSSYSARHFSSADAPLARLATNRVLRRGLGEISPELTQQAILGYLTEFCNLAPTIELAQQEEDSEISTATASIGNIASVPNEQQLQVVLVEMSHIVTSLGEAACELSSSSLMWSAIRKCRVHADPGVRYETAILSAALVNSVPHSMLCELLQDGIDECKAHHEQLLELLRKTSDSAVAAAAETATAAASHGAVKRSFRPKPTVTASSGTHTATLRKDSVSFLAHQYALHGNVLMLSTILHQVPHLSQSVPSRFLTEILTIAENLVSCQFNESLAKHNAGAACTCVRAGYSLLAAAVTIGPSTAVRFLQNLIDIWEKTGRSIVVSTKHFFPAHDLICLEAMISSLLSFLKFCSSLLISVPDALNRINLLLEKLLPLVDFPDGRLGAKPANPAAAIRLNSVKASIMETLSWLPPGSYPIAARQLFSMASRHIQESVQNETCTSLLQDLLPNEDKLLDLRSFNRAFCCSQVQEANELIESIVALISDPANANESEAVMHSLPWKPIGLAKGKDAYILGCPILGYLESEDARFPSPSVLHEVSNWRRPASSSSSSRIRLVDSAIQAFAYTFGLQSSREQEMAISLLKSLLPTNLVDPSSSSSFSVKDALMSENERRVKSKQEHVSASNIVATVILCIKSLPRHMGNELDTETGPSWTKLAGEIFRILMSSCSALVRRSASEGLALLATCGCNENALALQTIVLASLEETMQGTSNVDGKLKKAASEAIIFSSSAALLTVGCLQRASFMTSKNSSNSHSPRRGLNTSLPLSSSHMIRRLLMSLSSYGGPFDTVIVRVCALHSLSLVIAHYNGCVDDDWLHVLQTASLVVEQTFISVWTVASSEGDKGQEVGKLTLEPSLQAGLLRLMHSLLRHTGCMLNEAQLHARFTSIAVSILEVSEKHPTVVREALAFFDSLCIATKDIAREISSLNTPCESYYVSMCVAILQPERISLLARNNNQNDLCSGSFGCQLGALKFLRRMIRLKNATEGKSYEICSKSFPLRCRMFCILEMIHGNNCFRYSTKYRGISAHRIAERWDASFSSILNEVTKIIEDLCYQDAHRGRDSVLLNRLLFFRILASGVANKYPGTAVHEPGSVTVLSVIDMVNSVAASDARIVLSYVSPSRWQVKKECSRVAQLVLTSLSQRVEGKNSQSPNFNPIISRDCIASQCREFNSSLRGIDVLQSYASLHIEEIISTACSLSTATSDQAELPSLQLEGLHLLSIIVRLFSEAIDPESNGGAKEKVLTQFSSQIVSSVRHALSEPSSLGSMRLYLGGCEGALLILDTMLVSDVSVLRRLFRPILFTDLNMTFKSYTACVGRAEEADSGLNCVDLTIFRRITRIGTFAQIQAYIELGVYDGENLSQILVEAASKEQCLVLAMHAAALSIDAFRLSYGSKVARNSSSHQLLECDSVTDAPQTEFDKGLYYSNINDLSDVTLAAFDRFWPALATFAASRFAAYLNDVENDADRETKAACEVWLLKVLPLLLTGARRALQDISSSYHKICKISSAFSAQRIASMCIYGIRKSLSFLSPCEDRLYIKEDLEYLVADLTDSVLLPCTSGSKSFVPAKELFVQCCCLITDLCTVYPYKLHALTRAFLAPLALVQVENPQIDDASSEILSTCLRCVHLALTGAENALAEPIPNQFMLCMSLIDIGLRLISLTGKGEAASVQLIEATRNVLSLCFRNPSLSVECKRTICVAMSSSANWGAWSLASCYLEDGSGLICSLKAFKEALGDDNVVVRQNEVLAALRSLLQESSTNYCILSTVMNLLGSDILFLLKRSGIFAGHRQIDEEMRRAVCTEAAELLLVAFHQLVMQQTKRDVDEETKNEPAEDAVSRFLDVLFDVLVALIQHNGLPNSATGNERSDPDIGKMCAKIIVQIAKTSAAAFKMSVFSMSAEARGILESSMRAELTGYPTMLRQTQSVAYQKKGKINFKSFT